MSATSNAGRATTAFQALERFYDADRSDCAEAMLEHVTDALADLRHFCGQRGIDYARAARLAELHFKAEVCEEEA